MAGSNDFTGQNIQDTYQRVLQISSSGELADGTGSLVPLLEVTASHAISASHEITKEVSSSYAETASMASDSFIVQGNITASGNISQSNGNLFTNQIELVGNNVVHGGDIGLPIQANHVQITNPDNGPISAANVRSRLHVDGDITTNTHITASGDISASGNIQALTGSFENYEGSFFSVTPNIQKIGDILGSGNGTELNLNDDAGSINFGALNGTNKSITLSSKRLIIDDENSSNTQRTEIRGSITASGNISASGNLHISSSITFGDGVAQIIGPGNNDYLQLSTDDVSIFINGAEVINVDNDSINLNASNGDIDVKITHDNGVNAFNSDASTNRVKLRDFVTIGSGSAPNADPNALYVSGSQFNSSNITASGDISASGDIIGNNISASGDIVINEGQKLILDGNDTAGLTPAGNTYIHNAGTADEIEFFVGGTQKLEIKQTVTHFNNGAFKVTGQITASGDISASGNIVTTGNVGIGTDDPQQLLHVLGSTPRIRVEAQANGTPQIELKNNQSPDFSIKNVFSDGGFQIASTGGPAKSFVTIGASDGDVIELSGSVNVTGLNGNVTASGDISASGDFEGNSYQIQGKSGITYNSSNTRIIYGQNNQNSRLRGTTITLGDDATQHVTASGIISSSNVIYGNEVFVKDARVRFNDNVLEVANKGIKSTGPITGSSHISASGDVMADRYFLQGTRILSNSGTEIQINETTLPIHINGPSIGLQAPVTASGIISSSGNILTSGDIIALGNISTTASASFQHLEIEDQIIHSGDTETRMRFSSDTITFDVGGTSAMLTIAESSQDIVTIGNGNDVDFKVRTANDDNVIFTQGSTDRVGIGTSTPSSKLSVNGDMTVQGNVTASAIISGSQKVLSHEYHYCYHTTADDFKGDIVRFGTGPGGDVGNLVAGKLYCYQSDTHWELADADTQALATGMLGICVADGTAEFLVKGFAASAGYTSLDTAGPIFISATAGDVTATVPASSNQYVRVVGYCTSGTSRAIYFDPDKTWVKRS